MSRRPFYVPFQIPLERNFADLHGGIILPVPALDLVLAARLILEYDHLAMAVLRDDLAGYGGSGGILAGYQLGLISAHREHFAEGDLASHIPREPLDLHGFSWRYAVLLPSATNYGVHQPSDRHWERQL